MNISHQKLFQIAAFAIFAICCLNSHAAETKIAKWRISDNGTPSTAEVTAVDMQAAKPGHISFESEPLPVKADTRISLAFKRKSANLSSANRLSVLVKWLDNTGNDIDAPRAQLGFPPLSRNWEFSSNSADWADFADTMSVPGNAASLVLSFRLDNKGGATSVQCSDVRLVDGELPPAGIELPLSGKPDAGPLSKKPDNFVFADNLVRNAAFEEGGDHPEGWKIEGDNTNSSAVWQTGGAFSGKRCLKIADRGPYVKSWGEKKPDVYVPGGEPAGNYSGAREEVSARWVSDAVPVTPGKIYQTTSFLWYANRQNLDRGNINPVRIQFLDARGKVIRYQTQWDDWMINDNPFMRNGWVISIGNPLTAPSNAVSARVAVALSHAFYDMDGGLVRKRPDDRGCVLVDNISFFEVKSGRREIPQEMKQRKPGMPETLFWDTAKAGGLPFVPTSIGFRPNTLSAESMTPYPGGIIMRKHGDKSSPSSALSLSLTNCIGDTRNLEISCSILDSDGAQLTTENIKAKINPFGSSLATLKTPDSIMLGAYSVRYEIVEDGVKADTGETRFAIMEERTTGIEERGRMDYPFSLWAHTFPNDIGTERGETLGRLFEAASMGKTWFGIGGGIYLGQYVEIKDETARNAAIEKRINEAKEVSAAWRKYGVTPMARMEPTQVLDPSEYPILKEVVGKFVSALKDDIHLWRHGTESMHGGVRELDLDKVPAGAHNAQGGANYLIWGRRGTVRQYWAEYFAAFDAAKAADPSCLFGPQCASDIEGNVLRLFFKVGDKSKLDMFGMNTYISAFAIWPPNIMELRKNGAPDLPIFISEFDAQARCKPSGEKHFAEETDAVRRMVQYWTAVLYSFPSFFHMEQWGMILGNDDGSLTTRGRVRPQFVAYAVMTENLGAGKFTEKIEFPQAVAYVRERSVRKGPVAVMWSGASEANIELEVGTDAVELCDIWGNRRKITADNGIVSVDLTPMPVYLLGANRIKAAQTVKLTIGHATLVATQSRVAVEIMNGKKDVLSGTVELVPESAIATSPSSFDLPSLPSGGKKTFIFDVTPLDNTHGERHAMRAKLKTKTKTYESVAALDFACAPSAVKPPALDGDLSDWPDTFQLVADSEKQFSGLNSLKPWGGPKDLSGKMRLQWDKDNLYVAAEVADDVHSPAETPGTEFAKDSIEMLFDVTRGLRRDSPFQMITLADFPDKPRVRRYDGPLPKGDVSAARIIVKRKDSETIYEAAIPWGEISKGFTPKAGDVISIAVTFDDHDGGNTGRRCMSWASIVNDKNPSAFGDVILAGPVETGSKATGKLSNLIPNGDFEDPKQAPGDDMGGWRSWWPSKETEKNAEASITSDGMSGSRCLKIHRLSGKSNFTTGEWTVPVKPGEVYYFSAMAKMDERSVGVVLGLQDDKGKRIDKPAWNKPVSAGTESNYGWDLTLVAAKLANRSSFNPVSGVFEIPEGAVKLSISFSYSWSNGDAFIDNCVLYRLREGMPGR